MVFVWCSIILGVVAQELPMDGLFPYVDVHDFRLRVSPGSRRCCLLGATLEIAGWMDSNQITEVTWLGQHNFNSGKQEENGLIGTCKAGFVDTAHLRYASDLLLKLALEIEKIGIDGGDIELSTDAGKAIIHIHPSNRFRGVEDILTLAGSIVLDMTTWHEIITWYDYSTVPLYTEKGSSFSLEDAYSNQLGVYLGKRAILRSNIERLPYAVTMTEEIENFLIEAVPFSTKQATEILWDLDKQSNSAVIPWIDSEYGMANYRRLLQRNYGLYGHIEPVLPPQEILPIFCIDTKPILLEQPSIWEAYTMEIDLFGLYPSSRQVSNITGDIVTQWDFPMLIDIAKQEFTNEIFIEKDK